MSSKDHDDVEIAFHGSTESRDEDVGKEGLDVDMEPGEPSSPGPPVPLTIEKTQEGYPLPMPLTLQLPDVQTAREFRQWFDRVMEDMAASEDFSLHAILLGHRWEWQEFDQWHARFNEDNHFPYMWTHVGGQDGCTNIVPFPDEMDWSGFRRFASLSLPARRLAIALKLPWGSSRPFKATWARKKCPEDIDLNAAMSELIRAGLISSDVALTDHLKSLKNDDLRDALERHGQKKSGVKAELVERLAATVDPDNLQAMLPADQRGELYTSEGFVSEAAADWVRFMEAKIELLSHTVSVGYSPSIRDLNSFRQSTISRYEIMGVDDDCPVCSNYDGTTYAIGEGPAPPFHPGCRCGVVAVTEYSAATENSDSPAQFQRPATERSSQSSGCGFATLWTMMVGAVSALLLLLEH